MGLNVLVLEPIVPPRVDLDDIGRRHKFCEENDCSPHFITESREIEKLSKTPWLISWDEQLIDWKKTFEDAGKNMDDWELFSHEIKDVGDDDTYEFTRKDLPPLHVPTECDKFIVNESNIKTKIGNVKGIWLKNKEIGYQRKGATQSFYDDGKWDEDTVVTTKEELESDWKKYFESSQHFKENILDKFVEGRHVVVYW